MHSYCSPMKVVEIIWRPCKNCLPQNHKVDCLETWYLASGDLVLQYLLNDDPGLVASPNLVLKSLELKKLK